MGLYGIIRKSVHEHMVEGSCGQERCDSTWEYDRSREFNTRKEDVSYLSNYQWAKAMKES